MPENSVLLQNKSCPIYLGQPTAPGNLARPTGGFCLRMKQVVRALFGLGLVVGLTAHPVFAQTTNGVTTGAERQALNDAYTRTQAQRAAQATPSSPGANTPSSSISGSGRQQTLTEKEAEMNALFGFETAEQKAAAGRAVLQRYRDQDAAERASRQREFERAQASRARQSAYDKQLRDFETNANADALPWVKARFTVGDARQLGYVTGPHNVGDMKPETLALVEQLKASRGAFLALCQQPNASYEQLRKLARELPQKSSFKDLSGGWTFGMGTAMQQYDLLFRRFPERPTAAADALQASHAYLSWNRLLQEGFDEPLLRQQALTAVVDAAASYPVLDAGGAAELSAYAGMAHLQGADSALVLHLARGAYASLGRRLQAGPAANGPVTAALRVEAGRMAEIIAEGLYGQQRRAAARQWMLRVCQLNPAAARIAASNFICSYPNYATLLRQTTPADWDLLAQALNIAAPTRPAAVVAWLQDTVFVPDHPRWPALTADQQTDLAQARALAEHLIPSVGDLFEGAKNYQGVIVRDMRLATWAFVCDAAGSPSIKQAIDTWVGAAEKGAELGARNAYRAYLLGDKTPAITPDRGQLGPLYRLAQYGGESDRGAHQYRAALLLLDELPGYPPLGRANRRKGRRFLEAAAAAGCPAAADWLKRRF